MPPARFHLVGVAGSGMNPLAQALLASGCSVSGSDRFLDQGRDLDVLAKLRRAGVRLAPQDGSAVVPGTTAVVVSTAIEPGNPDLAAAARLAIPVLHRAEMLSILAEGRDVCSVRERGLELAPGPEQAPQPGARGEINHSRPPRELIAVAGTSGKTTVTGMVGFLLERLGDDPFVINGGVVAAWESPDAVGNVRPGRGPRWVVELDESDRSLLRFHPDWAVITNMSADHFPLEETQALFTRFAAQVRRGVVGRDDAAEPWRSFRPKIGPDGSRFEYGGARFHVPLLGRHNAENALQAAMLCERLGHSLPRVAEALAGFCGIRRRLEVAGTVRGVTVIDDFAHNPAKIRAAWEAVAPYHRRVLAAWRPHGFGPLASLRDGLRPLFAEMARAGVRLFLLPVFYAGGTAKGAVSSNDLAADLRADGADVEVLSNLDALVARLAAEAREGDAILIMGARDPDLPAAARRLVAALG